MKHHFVGGSFRVGGALLLGVCIVVGAYFLRDNATASADLDDPRTFVAAVPLRKYQETKDTDGDGLRDWFEELSGTDPNHNDANRPETSLTATSSEPFVADTETDKFAITFFDEMLRAQGGGLTDEEKNTIVNGSVQRFKALNAAQKVYLRADITILEEDGGDAIRAYGNAAAEPIVTHGANTENIATELVLLGTALQEDDPTYLKDLAVIEERYRKMITDLLAVSVPEPLIDEHLLLLNALQAMADDVAAFRLTFDDPLASFARFKRYPSDVAGLVKAIEGVRTALESESVVYQNDESGDFFFSIRP